MNPEWSPITDPRSTWCCKSARLRGIFFCFFYWADKFVRKGLGKILVFVVYGLVSFVFLMALGVVLPYESLWMPFPLIIIVVVLAFYFLINIIYHYHKASTTPSGRPPKSSREPLCWKCHNHKDSTTHHCSMCDECVVNMDHHCIWINRCVGAGNHRYFIQFTGFLAIACFLYCTAGFSTFYHNYWHPTSDTVLCHQELEESFFWISKLCSYGDEAIGASIFFGFCLCLIIFCLVGGLFMWNVFLVSSGSTYIGLLKGQNGNSTWKEFLCPWIKADFCFIWKDFLNLHQGRTFWRHIAIPSAHRPIIPLDWGDKTGSDSQRLLDV